MRVCTAKQMAAIDRETIAGGVPGERLMERAGQAMTAALLDFLAEIGSDDRAIITADVATARNTATKTAPKRWVS